MSSSARIPHLLLILDGWGHREAADDNAISNAQCPNWRRMWQQYPHSLIKTDGLAVGLPEGQMGNSEVGHMNLGAGRVVYQDLTRINLAIEQGEFANNPALNLACQQVAPGGCLHVFGLLSEGGVHSHQEHVFAMLRLAHARGLQRIAVHAFLDGRDTPPVSALANIEALQAVVDSLPGVKVASISGRYFAMDRDKRWDRVQRAYLAISAAQADYHAASARAGLSQAYAREETDEFVQPTVIDGGAAIADGDVIVFMNFRSDRARELSQCFVEADFAGFARPNVPKLGAFVSLTEYAKSLPVSAVAYTPQSMVHSLPEIIAARGLTQLRIAETEKYAHVTFFFNGGVEAPFPGESRILVPSPKVATYDLQPEMSCPEVTQRLVDAIASGEFDLLVCNIANPDMVGHTGLLDAAIKAVEAVDVALGKVEAAILAAGGHLLLTADHGNLEEMWDAQAGQPNTQHSMNPVPLLYIAATPKASGLEAAGTLRDIAPTLLALMGIDAPAEMTGKSLLLNPVN